MGCACSKYGGEVHKMLCWGNLMARDHFEDFRWLDNIQMVLQGMELGGGGLDWIDLAQDWNEWMAVVNKVMNFIVSPCIFQFNNG